MLPTFPFFHAPNAPSYLLRFPLLFVFLPLGTSWPLLPRSLFFLPRPHPTPCPLTPSFLALCSIFPRPLFWCYIPFLGKNVFHNPRAPLSFNYIIKQGMRVTIPEIAWHNKDPVFSADFCYRNGVEWRMATAGADSDVKVCFIEKNLFY